ncbi:MAG TPA: HAD family hydrolase [Planctomycetaceae bacterium]|nr:HAD family hydrolase [Planctomycetaceae bacterium]
MRYLAIACDFDGTLAHDGAVEEATVEALRRCRDSGRRLVMVTGRELADLRGAFARLDLFERIVAENGGTLYMPASDEERPLAAPPSDAFVGALAARGVAPVSVGRTVVATWSPHETAVLETIRDLGLELHVIFNKGAVMVLPSGINKASGLAAALAELAIPARHVVAIGDAENDHALLDSAAIGVAVANAVPMLRERADLVTVGDHGKGVIELIERLIENDLAEVEPHLP